jgi:hypothetical protein
VRTAHIAADYRPEGIAPTIYPYSLLDTIPEYFLPYIDEERNIARSLGYQPMDDSPHTIDDKPCLWQNPGVLSYAFSAPRSTFQFASEHLPPETTTPITSFERHEDRIALAVTSIESEPLVVVVQELAWPGWQVTVDGAPAKLESVGELIGVVLPPGTTPHYIVFQYIPPLFILGGFITLLTALICILYLLRADRYIPQQWKDDYYRFGMKTWARLNKVLTDPSVLTPED